MADWLDTDWTKRIKISSDNTKVAADISNEGFVVNLANMGTAFFGDVQNGGGDIRVTGTDGTTEIPREIVTCDTGANTGIMWIKPSSLSGTADTDLYVYYGNGTATDYAIDATYGAENVWTNYTSVHHLEGDFVDSTANDVDGGTSGADDVTGYFEAGKDFVRANNDECAFGTTNNITTDLTVVFWGKLDDTDNQYLVSKWNSVAGARSWAVLYFQDNWYFRCTNTGAGGAAIKSALVGNTPDGATWKYAVLRFDSSNQFIRGSLDGGTVTSTATGFGTMYNASAYDYMMGNEDAGGTAGLSDGVLDEVRVSNSHWSDNDITTHYNNESDNANFFTFNTPENAPAAGGAAAPTPSLSLLGVGT